MSSLKTTVQYSVMVPNEPAQLARATRIMSDAGVDLSGVTMSSLGAAMWLRFLAKEPERVKTTLENKGLQVCESRVLRLDADADSDMLDRVAAAMAARGINILSCYGHAAHGRATWILAVDKTAEAVDAVADVCRRPAPRELPSLLPA